MKPIKRTSKLDFVLTASERQLIERAAEIAQMCLAEFARPVVLNHARKIVERQSSRATRGSSLEQVKSPRR